MQSIQSLKDEIHSWTASDFGQRYPEPALLFAFSGVDSAQRRSLNDSTTRFFTMRPVLGQEFRPQFVAWLKKSDRNYFENLVIVGRSPQNDICLPVPTVSKLHAFFMKVGEAWQVNHKGTTNGLVINGQAIEGGRNIGLNDGDRILLGSNVEASFHSPAHLFETLRAL